MLCFVIEKGGGGAENIVYQIAVDLTLIISAVCGVFLLPVLMARASLLAALFPLYLMLALMSYFVSCTVLSLCETPVCKLCAPF